MPVFRPAESTDYETHGATFAAYINAGTGSTELCAWRLTIPADLAGTTHRVSREEILLVQDGTLHVTIEDQSYRLGPGDVALVPAGAALRVDTGSDGGSAWVTTSRGLTATTPDGSVLRPPWAQ